MKLSCDVIKDLLPLFAENIASDDTRIVVEEHLGSCPKCKNELDGFISIDRNQQYD